MKTRIFIHVVLCGNYYSYFWREFDQILSINEGHFWRMPMGFGPAIPVKEITWCTSGDLIYKVVSLRDLDLQIEYTDSMVAAKAMEDDGWIKGTPPEIEH